MRIEIVTNSPEETQRLGEVLGKYARPGHIFLLTGRLGAGKTALTQGIARGAGSTDMARSPTFVLVTQYRGRLPIHHMDLYRLGSAVDVIDIGIDEYLNGDGLCVIEWADKASQVFPPERLDIQIDYLSENTRKISVSSDAVEYEGLLSAVKSYSEQR